ncbi:MAG: anion permease [Anaerolineae bacterium]|nr:anion permease [Anaerolineae bacterium]
MKFRLSFANGIALLGSLIVAILFFFPVAGLDQQTTRIAALTLFLVVFWATNVVPPYFPVLIFFALAMIFQVISPALAFSGFASGAFWLVFGGLVIGAAFKETGLATRIADGISRFFGRSYRGLIGGLVVLGVLLSFIMPSSMGRVVMLVPIALALADRYGYGLDAPGRYGILLAMIFGAHTPSFGILPANVPNMILAGTTESVWGITIPYGQYFFLNFPVLGLLKALLIFALVLLFFPDHLPEKTPSTVKEQTPMSADEKRLGMILIVVVLMWAFDFLHGIAPSWVALAAALVLLLPGIGVLPADTLNKRLNIASLIFVAGLISMGAMIAQSELTVLFSQWIENTLPLTPGADFGNYLVLSITTLLTSIVGTVPTVPAVLVPLADVLASLSGLPLLTVLMIQVVGFSTIFFPYQAAPLVVGVLLANIPARIALRFTLVLGFVTLLLLLPLDYLWLQILGYFG